MKKCALHACLRMSRNVRQANNSPKRVTMNDAPEPPFSEAYAPHHYKGWKERWISERQAELDEQSEQKSKIRETEAASSGDDDLSGKLLGGILFIVVTYNIITYEPCCTRLGGPCHTMCRRTWSGHRRCIGWCKYY